MSEEPLKRLTNEGYNVVLSKVESDKLNEIPPEGIHKYTREDVGGTLNDDLLRRRVDAVLEHVDFSTRSGGTIADSALAPTVRMAVNLTPRQAADPGVWHYLASVKYPDFVTERWGDDKDTVEKFLGAGRNPYTNAFGRLWWGAELTKDPETESYVNAHKLYNNQTLANFVLDRKFRRYRPASRACAEVLYEDKGDDIRTTTTRFRKTTSTFQLEERSYKQLCRQISRIRNDVVRNSED
jgi:hypothetical protein